MDNLDEDVVPELSEYYPNLKCVGGLLQAPNALRDTRGGLKRAEF